jgi:hypothetical protein
MTTLETAWAIALGLILKEAIGVLIAFVIVVIFATSIVLRNRRAPSRPTKLPASDLVAAGGGDRE